MDKNDILFSYYKSPAGELILGEIDGKICLCDWSYRKKRRTIDKRLKTLFNAQYVAGETPLMAETKKQLSEYFDNQRTTFDIPIAFAGSDFQQGVWNALLEIPYGETRTYKWLAKIMGNEKAVRPVASANGSNSLSILVPCHRIIGFDGELVGYAGGLNVKRKLLSLESSNADGTQLDLFKKPE